MLSEKEYINLSLESNLFFLRIAKEHTIFAAASLPPRDLDIANKFMVLKSNFEMLLDRTIAISQGMIRPEVLSSGELVTDNTLQAENVTQQLTGLPINTNITKNEMALAPASMSIPRADLAGSVQLINLEAIKITKIAIEFQTMLLRNILNCKSFSYAYPLMLDHVTREAQYYVMLLTKLENKDYIDSTKEIIGNEINWNRIMDEHPKFIRGYLDPSETALFEEANRFSKEFDKLESRTNALPQNPEMLPAITKESYQMVKDLRDFKKTGTEGILACKIKSIMAPLLGDHVTREANHYLRLLKSFSAMI